MKIFNFVQKFGSSKYQNQKTIIKVWVVYCWLIDSLVDFWMSSYSTDSSSLSLLSMITTFYLICLSFAFFSLYLHSSKKNLWVIFIILIFYSLHRIKCSCCETMAVFFGLFFAVKNRVVYSDIVHDKLDSYPFFMMLLVLVQIDSYTSSKFSSLVL